MSNPVLRRRSYLPLLLELIARVIARMLYRVRTSGADGIPATGGVLLIANHISYVDVVVLQLACPRPIRYVGHWGLRRTPFFQWCFHISGAIPISSEHPLEGMRAAVRALKAGELVCVCPEGHISRTGQIDGVRLLIYHSAVARFARRPSSAAAQRLR